MHSPSHKPMQPDIPYSRKLVLLRDLRSALRQQMFFWGRDVLTSGNLLIEFGFTRLPSPGLKGTSCYRQRHLDGVIELHGACAGWYPCVGNSRPGFLFVRTTGRCTAHHLHDPVIPGRYQSDKFIHDIDATMSGAMLFAEWLAEYERWILDRQGADYRNQCRQMLGMLPKGRPWLLAEDAAEWLRTFAQHGPRAPRALDLASALSKSPALPPK
jgi:hypothetical protein